jgi:predicted permease
VQALLDVILPVFLVIAAGYLAVYKGYFSDSGVDGLTRFSQSVAIPCLLFNAISRLDLSAGFRIDLLFSFYTGAILCFILGAIAARAVFKRPVEDCIAIGFCCLFSNSVLLGLPITERAFGPDALTGNFAIIALHAPVLYLIGVTAMEVVRGQGQGPLQKARSVLSSMFHNALIVGIGLGLIVNLTSLPLPTVMTSAVDLIASAALPAALFGLGGMLVRYKPEGDMKVIVMVSAFSLIVHPAFSYGLSQLVGLDRDAMRSVVLTAAMAPGINTYIFANMYGAGRRVAASAVLLSTVLSVLTVWVWLLILP